ncbi:DUF805 domain-containing protein [Stakelama tenebrarum]|uniref:DUF805 domain-containing protein n=1 Tax=Stakelama tenebrarum TaxID=2711215 RepID=A0A6G6Y0B2_9SPHN|nr:DUF805 domain-containing protein [Sphingosinithalassobacter tenebrarum]QIG78350.1 DUF805 domain-containing protein [Sphingosinithalassobacter tenebrarum]
MRLADVTARMTRTSFLRFSLMLAAASALALAGLARLDASPHISLRDIAATPWRALLPHVFAGLLAAWLAAARLHDMNRRGWGALLAFPLAAGLALPGIAAAPFGTIAAILWLTLLVSPATIGPNRFGPDPRGWQSQAQFDRQAELLAEQTKLAMLGRRGLRYYR